MLIIIEQLQIYLVYRHYLMKYNIPILLIKYMLYY